ncbi:anti-sigma factor antagonist (plasmid) [Streptomyces sp. NBC_01218]|uniref:anti-sigma factor antagonist n=1 Tax=Streptomyces sp. NBC_01218 TaxID=2903780 RepID=UPI002E0D4FF6|nr:anti-sigma factor antagonist [Streptomyces sp. NBC_01218]
MDPDTGATDALVVLDVPFQRPRPHHVLTLRGSTACGDAELEAAFDRVTRAGVPLIVDLAGLVFGSELLLGLLLAARHTTTLILVGPVCGSFQRRLRTTGTLHVFDVRPTLTEALTLLPC